MLTGKHFFPNLISAPFHHGLIIVFSAAAIMSIIAAVVSLTRGKQYYYQDEEIVPTVTVEPAPVTETISPNGSSSLGSVNGHSAPVAGPAETPRRAAGG